MEETQSAGAKRHYSSCNVLFFLYHINNINIISIVISEASKLSGTVQREKTKGHKTGDETQRWQRHASLFTVCSF